MEGRELGSDLSKKVELRPIDIEELDLKFNPINSGLGFHGSRGKLVQVKSFVDPTVSYPTPAQIVRTAIAQTMQQKEEQLSVPNEYLQNGITIGSRVIAWMLDTALIFSGFLLTLAIFAFLAESTIVQLLRAVGLEGFLYFSLVTFGLYYLIYFTVLDMVGTPGKFLLGLKLKSTTNNGLRAKQTFMRAFVTLTAIMLFYWPLFNSLPDKLSETKIER